MEDQDDKDRSLISVDFKGFDPFGIKDAVEMSKEATKFGLEAARALLDLTCKPVLQEFGSGLKDKFTSWKLNNIIRTLEKANGKLIYDPVEERLKINPRVAYDIIENAALIEDDDLQEMWAGLFVASCRDKEDDENIFFTDILKRLTAAQVKLLNYLCVSCQKRIAIKDLPQSRLDGDVDIILSAMTYDQLLSTMGTESRLKADSEFSQLEAMGLIQVYLSSRNQSQSLIQAVKHAKTFYVKPLVTALRLYVKCQGSAKTPFEFFLPEIMAYYQGLFSGYKDLGQEELLKFIEEEKNLVRDDLQILSNASSFNFKTANGLPLTKEELTPLLRAHIVRFAIHDLNKDWDISVDKISQGRFNYKKGFIL